LLTRDRGDEQVARDAGAVVLIVPPAEEADRLEGALRRVAEKAIPVHRLRAGVGRNRVLPRSNCGVPVVPRLDEVDRPDRAAGEQLLCFGVDDGADPLTADLQHATGFLLDLDYLMALRHLLDHRLLEVDVLARVHGVDRYAGMPVVGYGDDDRVHVLPR